MHLPKLIVFASGGKNPDQGGSGFKNLVESSRNGILQAEIVAVVSNNAHGGVCTKATALGIPFIHSPYPRTALDYQKPVARYAADFVALSGWLGFVEGLNPRKTFNIHPAIDLRKFGGKGFHGHKVHEAVMAAYARGEVTHSGVVMHFATAVYDDPRAIFFSRKVPIDPGDDADSLGRRVNALEQRWQAIITDRVVHEQIRWDGINPETMRGADLE